MLSNSLLQTAAMSVGAAGGAFLYSYGTRQLARNSPAETNAANSRAAQLAKNIEDADRRAYLQNLRNAYYDGEKIPAIRIGATQLSVPVALAKELFETHKAEPCDLSRFPRPLGDEENAQYERYEEKVHSLYGMLLDLSNLCDFAAFNQSSMADPTALGILVRINYPEAFTTLQTMLRKFRNENGFKRIDDVAKDDLLLYALLHNSEPMFATLLDAQFGNIDINKQDDRGNTVSHRLMLCGDKFFGNIFTTLQHGADLNLLNKQQQTVRDLALACGIAAAEFDRCVDVGLHWRMHTVAAAFVQQMSRAEYSAFVCNAANVWGAAHPDQADEVPKIIDRSLNRIWNGNVGIDQAQLNSKANLDGVILSTKQTALQFSDFIYRTTQAWNANRVAQYVQKQRMSISEVAEFIKAVVEFWLTANPEFRKEAGKSTYYEYAFRELFYSEHAMNELFKNTTPDRKYQEAAKDLILTTDKYAFMLFDTLSLIVKTWQSEQNKLAANAKPACRV